MNKGDLVCAIVDAAGVTNSATANDTFEWLF